MEKFKNLVAIVLVVLVVTAIIGVVLAVEVGVLILLGFTYESWQALAIFLVVFGLNEFVIVLVWKSFIDAKVQQYHIFHKLWGHLIISFTLIMICVNLMDSISLPIIGAIIYAIITAILYGLIDRIDRNEETE